MIQLYKPLTVQLSAYSGVRGVLGIARRQNSLPVADDSYQKAVQLHESRVYFRTEVRQEFQVFAVVDKPGNNIVKVVKPPSGSWGSIDSDRHWKIGVPRAQQP